MEENTKILICDDDIAIADVLQIILESDLLHVNVEYHSSRILNRISIERPDVLIIDLWMPEMQGDDIIKSLRSNKEYDNLKIISMSASIEGEATCKDAGADAFISKPFNIEDIIGTVNRFINF